MCVFFCMCFLLYVFYFVDVFLYTLFLLYLFSIVSLFYCISSLLYLFSIVALFYCISFLLYIYQYWLPYPPVGILLTSLVSRVLTKHGILCRPVDASIDIYTFDTAIENKNTKQIIANNINNLYILNH